MHSSCQVKPTVSPRYYDMPPKQCLTIILFVSLCKLALILYMYRDCPHWLTQVRCNGHSADTRRVQGQEEGGVLHDSVCGQWLLQWVCIVIIKVWILYNSLFVPHIDSLLSLFWVGVHAGVLGTEAYVREDPYFRIREQTSIERLTVILLFMEVSYNNILLYLSRVSLHSQECLHRSIVNVWGSYHFT